jgi:hypothetical protein
MADYREMIRKILAAGGRESSNVQDLSAYPPRVSPHSGSGAHYYGAESQEYRDLPTLAVEHLLTAMHGKGSERNMDNWRMGGQVTPGLTKAFIKSLKPFDPEGSEFDYGTAKRGGMKPDSTGHWGSRDPETGQMLKGRSHPTWDLGVQGEGAVGNEIYRGPDGKYYSRPRLR